MAQPRKTYTDTNETGCCPVPNIEEWDEVEFTWDNKKFIRDYTRSFFYVPLNMGKVIERVWKKVTDADASPPNNEWMLLSRDVSPWKGEQYASVTKEVDGAENVTISGKFHSKVFEGEYKDAKNWVKEMQEYVESKGEEMKDLYFFYTTCPKCAKHYGKNYTIALAKV